MERDNSILINSDERIQQIEMVLRMKSVLNCAIVKKKYIFYQHDVSIAKSHEVVTKFNKIKKYMR